MKFYMGTDVGGTFTDLWAADDSGKSQVFKSPRRGGRCGTSGCRRLWTEIRKILRGHRKVRTRNDCRVECSIDRARGQAGYCDDLGL